MWPTSFLEIELTFCALLGDVMSKQPQEEPDWQWLEDGILSLGGAIWAFFVLLVTLTVNLVYALIGIDPNASDDEDTRTNK